MKDGIDDLMNELLLPEINEKIKEQKRNVDERKFRICIFPSFSSILFLRIVSCAQKLTLSQPRVKRDALEATPALAGWHAGVNMAATRRLHPPKRVSPSFNSYQ